MIADNLKHLKAKDSHSSVWAVLYLSPKNRESANSQDDALNMEGGEPIQG